MKTDNVPNELYGNKREFIKIIGASKGMTGSGTGSGVTFVSDYYRVRKRDLQ
jgi:hypothetical protein